MGEGIARLVDREGLEQIIVNAAGDEVAVEPDIVHGPRRDHDRPRLADFRERVDVVERIRGLAQVDEQDVRAGRDGQRLDRVAKAALVDLFRRPAVLDGDRPQHVGRRIVAHECGERIAQTRASLEWSVHYLLPPAFFVLMSWRPFLPVGSVERYRLTALVPVFGSTTVAPSRPWTRSSGFATIAARFEFTPQPKFDIVRLL